MKPIWVFLGLVGAGTAAYFIFRPKTVQALAPAHAPVVQPPPDATPQPADTMVPVAVPNGITLTADDRAFIADDYAAHHDLPGINAALQSYAVYRLHFADFVADRVAQGSPNTAQGKPWARQPQTMSLRTWASVMN